MVTDREEARRGIALFLRGLGYDLKRPDLAETPARVVDAFANDLLAGEAVDLAHLLEEGSEPCAQGQNLVVVRDVRVTSVCPHHLLPAQGSAVVAYLPGKRLVGLGTLARLVEACARRLTLQERIGEQVVGALVEHAAARGAYCELTLAHDCLGARGARQPDARLVTLARRGELAGPEALAELELALGRRSSA
jgi:GTP cyclohydrolase I